MKGNGDANKAEVKAWMLEELNCGCSDDFLLIRGTDEVNCTALAEAAVDFFGLGWESENEWVFELAAEVADRWEPQS